MNYAYQIQAQSLSLGQPSLGLDPDPYWLLECEQGNNVHSHPSRGSPEVGVRPCKLMEFP